MKYVLIIPDGAADEPQVAADGLTPLQAARTPAMDEIVRRGVIGRANHVPEKLPSGSDVGMMSLMGYDPLEHHTGRAPIEAAAQEIAFGENDWAIRCNLVTIADGCLRSFTAGQIDDETAGRLINHLQQGVGDESGWQYHAGVGYRNLLIHRPGSADPPFSDETLSTPPHDMTDLPVTNHLPSGPGSEMLVELMDRSREMFADSDVDSQATQVWLWGLGRRLDLESFHERFGLRGAVVTAVDLVRGLGRLLGWSVIDVQGATGYLDTDYEAKGRAVVDALAEHDLVVVHVEATDQASHEGDVESKILALERIDENIVGPVHEKLSEMGDHRILVSPDHPTLLRTRTHAHGTVPVAVCGTAVIPDEQFRYDEVTASSSPLVFDPGCGLMPWFLGNP